MYNKTIVLVTGGFDPIHGGHIDYFNAARQLGDILIVGINSDSWLERKKGQYFMPITERVQIIENLKMVDNCILFNDDDNCAIEAIKNVKNLYPNCKIIFANGGDRKPDGDPVPEVELCNRLGITLTYNIGDGGKIQSSSWLLKDYLKKVSEAKEG